ncbi:uncharacterized protein LOC132723104 [Ruditapes philippinarum]|uniref:uncharacterized protein LOC132723104 n=1 Tax=Ruditapes philippinarum TaxID=129788 RepID=UPI00295B9280|nr:uncharacterized protein LOC132723104 [Ruditapes philippinarum]
MEIMRFYICLIVLILVKLISSTKAQSLRLRINQEKTVGKLVKFLGRLRAEEKIPLTNFKTVPGSFKPLPFPVNFSTYDLNGDATIEIIELVRVTGTAENVHMAFSASDFNGDGFVTEEEYTRKPWGYDPEDVILSDDIENYLEN